MACFLLSDVSKEGISSISQSCQHLCGESRMRLAQNQRQWQRAVVKTCWEVPSLFFCMENRRQVELTSSNYTLAGMLACEKRCVFFNPSFPEWFYGKDGLCRFVLTIWNQTERAVMTTWLFPVKKYSDFLSLDPVWHSSRNNSFVPMKSQRSFLSTRTPAAVSQMVGKPLWC